MTLNLNSLLTAQNPNLLARLALVRGVTEDDGLGFHWSVYKATHRFSNPLGMEFGEDSFKNSFQDYLSGLTDLIKSISMHGYISDLALHPIRVNRRGIIIDGAHRIAVLIHLGFDELDIELSNDEFLSNPDLTQLERNGMPRVFCEALEVQLLDVAAEASALVFFGFERKKVTRLLEITQPQGVNVIKRVDLDLNGNSKARLIEMCYGANDWFTPELGQQMTVERFLGQKEMATVLFLGHSSDFATSLKKKLRISIGGFERRIHGTDNDHDLSRLMTFFTGTGRHWANSAPPGAEQRLTNDIRELRSHQDISKLTKNYPLISGSTVLELYGTYQARDRDIIMPGWKTGKSELSDTSHVRHLESFGVDIDHLATNPEMYFFFLGTKVLSLRGGAEIYLSHAASDSGKNKIRLLLQALVNSTLTDSPSQQRSLIVPKARVLASRAYESLVAILPRKWRSPARRIACQLGSALFNTKR
jgi:hypothetical protein